MNRPTGSEPLVEKSAGGSPDTALSRRTLLIGGASATATAIAGIAAGIACAGLGGWLSLRHVLARPALQSLRDA